MGFTVDYSYTILPLYYFNNQHLINMSPTALDTAENFISQFESGLRTFGVDLKTWVGSLDLVTVGVTILLVSVGVLLFDLVTYFYAAYVGSAKDYQPFGRSLALGAAKVWDMRNELVNNYFDDVRGSRSLDGVTYVLDALAKAALEWEDPTNSGTYILPGVSKVL